MHRAFIAAMAPAILGGWVGAWGGTPQAVADNPVCTATWCSFLAPSHNLGCELSYHRGNGIADETYCQTDSPPQSVRMATDGTFKSCAGVSCIGNASEGTPTLGYGSTAAIGPFSCRSETSGVTCTVASGRGFTIASSGVSAVG
ncbi:hypothetical protein BST27_24335 [Mycobacterium intermedium]|uniref:Uncharacterized protein n=1 Tax=Mycobacterium intermedium TaxID=28445 RepID=A0A1E3SJR6_MYCIE|nr:hypothetical protein [Mycobacterium intermedium]MCV6962581.1 hypothetical protein [Mycobacterium intermedium]ODR02351.1 hypothetical protein BHQ20_04485 [Mycobacterium intermedium]OPE52818.1 hypothetical protein BV508_00890 [Mycobacterium intermedium]ORA96742.1 hypothetical protein BST27_24335 [Mycobacterium intermedium]